MIRELTSEKSISDSVYIIRKSFSTVADQFNLSRDNCPSHPSFIEYDNLLELKKKGVSFFGLFTGDHQAGFVAVEKSDNGLFFIEKLSVLPGYRHNGYGKSLVQFAIDYVKNHNGEKISIGVIDEHKKLKEWYKTSGFVETGTKSFKHLPFTVCFMEIVF